MKSKFLLLLLLNTFVYKAQHQMECATAVLPVEYEEWVNQAKASLTYQKTQTSYNIPVVVHIINYGETPGSATNISYQQVLSQIKVLNEDFNKLNSDVSSVPSFWAGLVADCQINFCPAKNDPQGNVLPEPGVHRVNAMDFNNINTFFGMGPYQTTIINSTIKPKTIWDPNKYLNIWCLDLGLLLYGYATMPDPGNSGLSGILTNFIGTTTTDGVVINYKAFGTTGSAAAPFNLGRTTTHEVGHWLGLRHIWGDSFCGNDYCNDTPTADSAHGGNRSFPLHVGNCSGSFSGEMFMNFMDYTNDNNKVMFTNDQKNRMLAIISGSPMRQNLVNTSNCSTILGEAETTKFNTPVALFPNPTNGNFNLNFNTSVGKGAIVNILTYTGEIVTQIKLEENSQTEMVNLNGLSDGIYFISIQSSNFLYQSKLIKASE